MLLEGGVTQNNYLDKDGKSKVLDDVYAAKIRENVTPYIDDYIKEKKDFSDWKRNEYLKEALILSTALPMGKGASMGIDAYKNYQRAKEIADLVNKRKDWGIAFRKAEGNPELAIQTLKENQRGFVPNALDIDGGIDFVWGKYMPPKIQGKKGKGYGLAHIEGRRNEQGYNGSQFVDDLATFWDDAIKKYKENHSDRYYYDDGTREAVIRTDWNGKSRKWLDSAYYKTNK